MKEVRQVGKNILLKPIQCFLAIFRMSQGFLKSFQRAMEVANRGGISVIPFPGPGEDFLEG
jgi:hypothetical protein